MLHVRNILQYDQRILLTSFRNIALFFLIEVATFKHITTLEKTKKRPLAMTHSIPLLLFHGRSWLSFLHE